MAILFIFLVNIQFLSGVYYYPVELAEGFSTASIDAFFERVFFIFLNGKYYYIFSFLFGIGFVVQYQNFQSRNKDFSTFFIRRMLVLLLIGLTHMIFIWAGDILSVYAVLGLFLLFFRDFDDKKLLRWALILLLMPLLHWIFMYATKFYYYYPLFEFVNAYAADLGLVYPDSIGTNNPKFNMNARFQIENWMEWFEIQIVLPYQRLGILIMRGRLFKVLALFLIGVWAGRRILQDGILENIAFIKKIAFWGLILGLPFNLLLAVLQYSTLVTGNLKHFLHHLFFIFGVAPLAMAYVALLALMLKARPTLFNFFIPVGQMALTNYLLQSILIILLFHNVGLGWYAKFGFTVVSGIAIGIFCMQIAFSSIWLKYFRFGPVEWIWRQLTYGKRMMLKKK
jgi:uncharacterized protein